jgi:hypothetical protein
MDAMATKAKNTTAGGKLNPVSTAAGDEIRPVLMTEEDEKRLETRSAMMAHLEAAATPRKVRLGDRVIYRQNGTDYAAIVTRVWNPKLVDLAVFGDGRTQYLDTVRERTLATDAERTWRFDE